MQKTGFVDTLLLLQNVTTRYIQCKAEIALLNNSGRNSQLQCYFYKGNFQQGFIRVLHFVRLWNSRCQLSVIESAVSYW